jgi:uncharacterized protein YdeI (YjbR/CyaY-like superfamily)
VASPVKAADYPTIAPKTVTEWRRWLRENHSSARGVWLVNYKASTGKPRLRYEESIPEALAYGWIDSVHRPLDGERNGLLFTPRRAGSPWSRTNKERIARLIRTGRMRPTGLAKIQAAKRDGSWSMLESVESLTVPADLKKALAAAKRRPEFDELTRSAKRAHLYALVTAKRSETRAKRVSAIVDSLR